MLPDATLQRLALLLTEHEVESAYLVRPLPPGILSAASGGLALLFPAATTPTQRYERAQRLRFALMGLLPPGQTEMIALNDSPLSVAATSIERGQLVYSRDEGRRIHYETMVLSQVLDLEMTVRRFFGE